MTPVDRLDNRVGGPSEGISTAVQFMTKTFPGLHSSRTVVVGLLVLAFILAAVAVRSLMRILLGPVSTNRVPAAFQPKPDEPVRLIFDTDMGNDIDDALALGTIHALENRGECRLLAVTISKDNLFCAPFCDLLNTFYGRGDIPIGVVRGGKTPHDSRYVRELVEAREGDADRFPHDLRSGEQAPDAVDLLRQVLADQPDRSVAIAVVGFSTNLGRLIDSPADQHSPLAGRDLVAQKCRFLSMMAGMFSAGGRNREFNIIQDFESAQKVFADWPIPIAVSGYEIGLAVKYPVVSIERDFRYVAHHPLREAYMLYRKMPYDQETWDLTSVLFAVRPDRGYFGLSEPGTIRIDANQVTQFTPDPVGLHRYLTVDSEQVVRVREALVQLVSQPPER